ncbi:MAG TPA: transcription-repair coupling factor [Candidatus Cybelea sp.]|nr:transcription-repair coupling factor [Candidatus Cybelea sp.]
MASSRNSLGDLLRPGARLTVAGAPEGHNARLLGGLAAAAPRGVLHLCRDDLRASAMAEALAFFAPAVPVLRLPAWDCLPYDRVSPNAEVVSRRMETLARLARAGMPKGGVLIATVQAALQRIPARADLAESGFSVEAKTRLDVKALNDYLVRTGYMRVGTVMEPGEFAMRGGLIDVFPPGAEQALRLDLFGDEVERIRTFDPLTQRSSGEAPRLDLVPVSEVPIDADAIQRFRSGYRAAFGAVIDQDPLFAAVTEGRRHIGMEHWLPLFRERLETIFDYVADATVTLDHLADEAAAAHLATIADHYQTRVAARGSGLAEAGSPYKPLPPDRLYMREAEWREALAKHALAAFSPNRMPEAAGVWDSGGKPGREFGAERAQPGVNVYDALRGHIDALRAAGKRVLLASFSDGSRDRLGGLLREHGVVELADVENFAAAQRLDQRTVGLALLGIERGFETAELAVIGEQDVLGDRLVRPRRKNRRAENFIAEASMLAQGDLVVHVDHGIGRYEGLQTLQISGAPHDCLLVIYDGGDKLYVPVENIEVLSRYGSEEAGAALDKLGGSAWQARRARLKQRLKDMADELIRIAAERELHDADRIGSLDGLYDEFCARFPYEETDDQARAIVETLDDLGSGKPMDRLVCGDVGFGKTEVALRAAFLAAMTGLQVAIICPTTLLARQHFRAFTERFRGYPLRIGVLSRLVSPQDTRDVKAGLAAGTVDIVIGTHALLGKTVSFKHLGLVVVDEEQHFGVKHKERLKQLRASVHVLTLTATPIPRTLQLALSGVRELSIIATPPVDRLAVHTFVLPFDPVVVREAILRERYRGGQTFYVCPRIADLGEAADFLRQHVPEVRVGVAHGRMAASELEQVMSKFYDGAYDVLVSTNIVESGLDIPAANTMVVHRADMFGLAQLYQLRGRVGRSKLRAFCYLTLPPHQKPSATAERRLQILQALDTLGAGFTLASHDLDLRGAGNLLGEEQSGHIREVGFELYQEMLEEAVAAARGRGAGAEAAEKWSPQIAIGTSVLIPDEYVSDLSVRLDLYRRIARLEGRAEIDAFAAELIDRFGKLPDEVEHLLRIISIKHYCRQAGIEKVDAGPRGATIAFRENRFANPAGMVAFLSQQAGTAKLRPDHRLVILRDWTEADQRIAGVHLLAKTLAEIAEQPQPAAQKTSARK